MGLEQMFRVEVTVDMGHKIIDLSIGKFTAIEEAVSLSIVNIFNMQRNFRQVSLFGTSCCTFLALFEKSFL